ncbi:MAG: hypothetical protein H7A31_03305 [Thermotogae bacterium]|nr:hypothetical protein [Thermotogota bacterium]MCP5465703.1 hypothetical protein [Thermotogota bacterium]HOO74334.1 hypothetical protein [Tepiditoga sp.]
MNILGPVVTSKTIGKSFLKTDDIIRFSIKNKINAVVLKEPHPKSWMRFVSVCRKYGIKPVIIYSPDENYLIKDTKEMLIAIRHYNKVGNTETLEKIKLDIPEICYPDKLFKSYHDEKKLSLEEYLQNCDFLSYAESETKNYEIKYLSPKMPYFGGYEELEKNILSLNDKNHKIINHELSIIKKMNASDYILTVKKISDLAEKYKIVRGPGRGSSVGSYLVYLLGINRINPLKYNLYFERFLNSNRKELPDIDFDVEAEKRNYFIEKISSEIGKYRVAQLRTYSTMKFKSCYKKVSEILNYKPDAEFFQPVRSHKNLAIYKRLDKKDKIFYRLMYAYEGIETAESVHAAGVLISEKDLRGYIPLEYKENIIIAETENTDLKLINMEKFDILALDTLNFLKSLGFNEEYENLEDENVYKTLSEGYTKGIFQLDSKSGKKISVFIKPQNFSQLVQLVALNRPGPIESGMVDSYLTGNSDEYLRELLPETQGLMIFQEQIIEISQKIGGLSPEDADSLRIGLSKKIPELIEKYKWQFIKNASDKIGEPEAKKLFEDIEKFAQYSFNKSHSVAYAHITYWLAKHKTYSPENFYLGYISLKGLDTDTYNEIYMKNIRLLTPSVKHPYGKTEKGFIIPPLRIIKGIGLPVETQISKIKDGTLEEFVYQCKTLNINKNITELLIKSGSLDHIDKNRKHLLRKTTELTQGKYSSLNDIKESIFGEVQKKSKEVETTIETLIEYEFETIGLPISNLYSDELSKTICKKTGSDINVPINGYRYKNMIFDSSGIYYSKYYSKTLKKVTETL